MLVSIIVLVFNRPKLTRQTLDSLHVSLEHAPVDIEVICIDNGSDTETQTLLDQYQFQHRYRITPNTHIGNAKNIGVNKSRGDWLYITDNDMYFLPGWFETILKYPEVYPEAHIIGAFRHPYHGLVASHHRQNLPFEQSDQQVGSSWFLSRLAWNQYGPLKENVSYGIDDVALCEKVKAAGHWVGSISPYKVLHCGATNSDGQLSPGGETLLNQPHPPGVIIA